MPTYDYRCLNCDVEFERFQRMTEEPLGECPECQGKVKRLIGTGAGIIFKGSGFYETDYRSSSYKKDAEKENRSKSGSGDSKPKKNNDTAKKPDNANVNV